MSILLFGCASVQQQTYLKKSSLDNISSVCVIITINDLNPLIAFPTDKWIRSVNNSNPEEAREDTFQSSKILERLAFHFASRLKEKNIFSNIDFQSCSDSLYSTTNGNYDAVIDIKIEELSLKRKYSEKFTLYIQATAKMVNTINDEVLWNRNEILESSEAYSQEFIQNNGIPILDKYLIKLAKKFSDEIIYIY